MENSDILIPGQNCFTRDQLYVLAGNRMGLEVRAEGCRALSFPIKTYEIDLDLIEKLKSFGIEARAEEDGLVLVDTLHLHPRKHWRFAKDFRSNEPDFRVKLLAELGFSMQHRGVIFRPQVFSTKISPSNYEPHFRLFRALTELDQKAPRVARELAASDGKYVVLLTEIHLGGTRNLRALFDEFADGNEAIMNLGREKQVFDPDPYRRGMDISSELFVTEPAQPKLFTAWQEQLENYRASLKVE